MRSAPVFQVATRPAPSSMKIAKSWMPSTSRRNVSGVSRGVVAAGTTRFASMMTSMAGGTFRASLSRRRVDRRGAATLEASMEDEVVELREHVPLAPHTTFGLGGKARYFVECDSEDEVRAALAYAAERRLPAYVLGGGSNVVFLDSGFPGIILRITIGGMQLRDGPSPEGRAGAGVDWDKLVQDVVQRGCSAPWRSSAGSTPWRRGRRSAWCVRPCSRCAAASPWCSTRRTRTPARQAHFSRIRCCRPSPSLNLRSNGRTSPRFQRTGG